MESSKEKRLGTGRVAFLARVEIFTEKINAGHTMATVYEEHQKELGISYSQFVNYVNRFIRKAQEGKKEELSKVRENSKPKAKEGFIFDPKSKEDLL